MCVAHMYERTILDRANPNNSLSVTIMYVPNPNLKLL